ncbi:hypothetical protein OROGR_012968 [Orobanche gracilis]
MHSFNLSSLVLPCANTYNPKSVSHMGESKTSFTSHHYPLPPENTFSNALFSLRTCTKNEDPRMCSCFHAQILKSGLEADVFIGNSLLNMYSKSDQLHEARNLFDDMPHRTIVSWTSMMSSYHLHGLADETILLFLRMLEHHLHPNEFTLSVLSQACASKGNGDLVEATLCYAVKMGLILDSFLQNSVIDAYAKLGMLTAAEKLIRWLYSRDVVSWTSVISSCVYHGNANRALALFCSMRENGVLPNGVTMLTVLQACSDINNFEIMQWIHGLTLKGNWCMEGSILNLLIEMYSINGYLLESMKIFCRFGFNNEGFHPSPETMANVLQGCANCGTLKIGEEIHGYLIKHGFLPSTIAENSLINMYAKNGSIESAFLLFRTMVNKDIISWNTIINCFVKNDHPFGALSLLGQIHREGSPDLITLLTSLEACSDLALLIHGQVIHGYLTRTGLLDNVFVQNALIDMYAKSGRLDFAEKVFGEMHEKDVGSWNSIIAAHGINGEGTRALHIFTDLKKSDIIKPNAITFVNILSACAHAGLVDQGLEIFDSMEINYNIRSRMEHFACMVDLLGRAGRVEQAEMFVRKMPVQPGPGVWGALLSACVLAGNLMIAEKAAKELAILEPKSSVWRVALSNAYAAAGNWRRVAEIRAELRVLQLRKEGGWSSVNVDGFEFSFMAGEMRCPESQMIYEVIGWLENRMRDMQFDMEIWTN